MLLHFPSTLSVIPLISPLMISALAFSTLKAVYSGRGFHPDLLNGPQCSTTHTNNINTREKEKGFMHSAKHCLYVANAPIYLFIKIIPTDIISIVSLCRIFIEPQLHVTFVTVLLLLLYE